MPPRRAFIPNETDRQLARALRLKREEAKLSQTELARLVGSSYRSLSRYETVRSPIPTRILFRLQEQLGALMAHGLLGVSGQLLDVATGPLGASEEPAPEEKRLLEIYRRLERHEKDLVLGRALSLLGSK
jgi:transcriptional regulator with XRE-family HTH domain